MKDRNIILAYLLAFAKNSWFWLGIWVFYYLKFTNYAGIGLIEAALFITIIITEIPTGAIADLFGKKKTLILAFFLLTVSSVAMGLFPNLWAILVCALVGGIGSSLYSGTLDALVYDTLKEKNNSHLYDKVIANINSIVWIAPAVCGAIGGFMYVMSPTLPFFACGFVYSLAFFAAFFLREPRIDSEKFSFHNFILQTKHGVKELTKTLDIREQTILLLSVGVFVVIMDEMLNSFLSVEFGFKAQALGILWSVLYLASSAASQLTPMLKKMLGDRKALILTCVIIAVTLLISPITGLILGGITLLIRSAMQALYVNFTSVIINNNTESKYRATTLSTFNMIKNIPYALTAYWFGTLSDTVSAKMSAFYLGIILIVFLLLQAGVMLRKKREYVTRNM
jgi:MFS family permease